MVLLRMTVPEPVHRTVATAAVEKVSRNTSRIRLFPAAPISAWQATPLSVTYVDRNVASIPWLLNLMSTLRLRASTVADAAEQLNWPSERTTVPPLDKTAHKSMA